MKCQMPGCQRNARQSIEIEGIFNGIYVDKIFEHCGRHRKQELNARIEAVKTESVAMAGVVNPFMMAPKMIRKVL